MNNLIMSGNKGESKKTSVVWGTENPHVVDLYEPQSLSLLLKWKTIEQHLRKQMSDVVISKLEGIVALFCALSESQSYKNFLSILILYLKTHGQESLTKQISDIVHSIFEVTPQSSNSKPRWLDDMSRLLVDWKLIINSPSFSKVSRVLSLLVTLGIVERQSVSLGNFELFAVEAQTRQANALDLMDAIVETIVYFAEGAYQCFTKGSLKPLLFSTSDIVQIEEQYVEKMTEWEFVRNGNLERFSGKSESQFDKELDALTLKLNELYKTMPNGAEKKIVQQKWEALTKVRTEFIAVRVSGGLRKAPYCVKIYGDSGVGKSTFSDIVMSTVLKAMNLPCTADYICTLNEADKYMSTYRSYITGIKMDDYGNTKSEFWETSPSDWIIKICNNIREYAVMADISNKGKITIEPGCLVITTNVENMHASKCSYNSMSIIRRAHMHVKLDVKEEFKTNNMLDSEKVLRKFGSLDQINDIWDITIRKPKAKDHQSQEFETFLDEKININIFDFIDMLVDKVQLHDKAQQSIVTSFKEPSNMVAICPTCSRCCQNCACEVEPHFGERLAQTLKINTKDFRVNCQVKRLEIENKIEDLAIDILMKKTTEFWSSPYSNWVNWVPESWMNHPYVQAGIYYTGKDIIEQEMHVYKNNFLVISCTLMLFCSIFSYSLATFVGLVAWIYFTTVFSAVKVAKRNIYMDEVVRRRGTLAAAFIQARDAHVQYACGLFAGLAVAYGGVKLYRALKDSFSIQGKLNPKSIDDIQERDAEINPWKGLTWSAPKSEDSFDTVDFALNSIKKNFAQITVGDNFSGALMLETHIVLIPAHMLPDVTTKVEVLFNGLRMKCVLNPEQAYILPNKDLAIFYLPNTCPFKSIMKFIVEDDLRMAMSCRMIGLSPNKEWFTTKLFWQYVPAFYNGASTMSGSHYKLQDINTFAGMCMSPIVTEKKPRIVGFHIGGVTGTPSGCGVSIMRCELETAIGYLYKKNDSFLPGPQAQEITDTVCGKQIALSEDVRAQCPSNFITGQCDLEVYGAVCGENTYRSEVIETPISSLVEEICGVPNDYGPPKFVTEVTNGKTGRTVKQRWQPWFASLEVCSKPSVGFDPAEVQRAMDDYKHELFELFQKQRRLWEQDMRPLNNVEIVSGKDGQRFIDAMKISTSMGYPIGGPKHKWLIDLPPTEENATPRTFKDEIWQEVELLYERADRGEYLNQIFGASLKDEPTKVTKNKVRVFQAAPIALQIAIRRYFLPIGRFLSMNPLIAECAVGINSHGPEWDELSNFMAKFGDDRIVAGDYSKYDLRMPAQLTLAAFSIMIDIAKWSGNYTPKDVNRMCVIAHDVCTPLVAYNGSLMRFLGTNPSGQNMTVYINSIVNSLLHRLAFFDAYNSDELVQMGVDLDLGRTARFRDIVAISTYGDDAKGSVRRGYDKFNHVSMAEYLGRNDMVFTMPDKESEPVPFMSRYEADFLKRKDRYDEDLGVFVGMLDEKSIFKSLHAILKSKVITPEDVSACNIEGGLREWFYHGREIYNLRHRQMKEIAERAQLHVRDLEKTFDDRIVEWKEKYVVQSGKITSAPKEFTETSLQCEVIALLGKPTRQEYEFPVDVVGKGDLVYIYPKFILVVETKVIRGKVSAWKNAEVQARKYATAFHILCPNKTVVGVIYTEFGFQVVKHFGPFVCPKKFQSMLDFAAYDAY